MENKLSRRKFLNAAAAVAALSAIPFNYGFKGFSTDVKDAKPNSKFGGVQIGAISYSWRSMPSSPKDIISYCLQAGISDLELMGSIAEDYLGLPKGPGRPPHGVAITKEQKAEYEKALAVATEAQRKWRLSVPMKKYSDLRKLFNDAGINIHIVKFSPANWTDEEIDYAFEAAKAMGAKGVTNEIGEEACRRLGPFAEKHKMYAIFHQHMQPAEPGWNFDKFLAYSPSNMLNFDAGHYFGSTGLHPNDLIKRLHNRIFSIHMKDKTGPKSTPPNTNQVWGKGEMPIADVLLLLKKEKWPIYVDIELEYEVPADSDAAKEVGKCVEYAKKILS
ncbi:MAG: sugar phosphate isomerase/epimerase [Bacteroidetes bacterium]|nr:sugar phosphate isomerase/epimerase [Bacteroidota bacterium]MCL6102405.1 sugar phosphate isomerase/epimerase [Bacteroidota bacterium]